MDCYGLKLIPAGNLRELIDEEIRCIDNEITTMDFGCYMVSSVRLT
jgi:hypothetical protein